MSSREQHGVIALRASCTFVQSIDMGISQVHHAVLGLGLMLMWGMGSTEVAGRSSIRQKPLESITRYYFSPTK